MAISYSVKINGVRVVNNGSLSDVVKDVDYTLTGTDGEASFSLPNTVSLGSPESSEFIEFGSLTEAQVVEWVESNDLSSQKMHIAYVVAKELERLAAKPKPLPWAPAPEPAPEAPTPPAAE